MTENDRRARTSGQMPVRETLFERVRHKILGNPRNLADKSMYQHIALVPLLAWVGLGADPLSSSAYGPEEAFKAIGDHTYLAVALAVATALTVSLISGAYCRLVENFPTGGGYGVASKMLGPYAGVVSGCALLVDYVLTITISIAAAGKALFSFLPPEWIPFQLPAEVLLIVFLTTLNLRGVRESVMVMMPMFVIFLITHVLLLGFGIAYHASDIGQTAVTMRDQFSSGVNAIGFAGVIGVFLHAYSLGGGTYTGIEAVSNALPLMREPQVQTAKRTMLYMAISLAITASGLLLCYLLWHVQPVTGKSLNAVLFEGIGAHLPGGHWLTVIALASEAALLLVAAQAGFLGGPRVTANMAVDSWLPHSFGSLSERLTIENGIVIMGAASLGILLYTGGDVPILVMIYSISVFLTFSLTMASMTVFWWKQRNASRTRRARRLVLFVANFLLCAVILIVVVRASLQTNARQLTISADGQRVAYDTAVATGDLEVVSYDELPRKADKPIAKVFDGREVTVTKLVAADGEVSYVVSGYLRTHGWIALIVLALLVCLCFMVRRHYRVIAQRAARLYSQFGELKLSENPPLPIEPKQPTAVILVGSYGALGIHTLLNTQRVFGGYFRNVVFVSVGVMDSGAFKGEDTVDELRARTEHMLKQYQKLATGLGLPCAYAMAVGTDPVDEAEKLCLRVAKEYHRTVFFAGKLIFQDERWYHRLLHNNTANAVQKRLHWAGREMVIIPARIQ